MIGQFGPIWHQGILYIFEEVMTRGFQIYNKIGTLTCSVPTVTTFQKINFFEFSAKSKGQVSHVVYQTMQNDETAIKLKEF